MKKLQILSKKYQICDIKKLKTIPWPKKISGTYYQTLKEVFCPLGRKTVNNYNDKKLQVFLRKMLKFAMLKCLNHSITTRNNAVTYYQTLE